VSRHLLGIACWLIALAGIISPTSAAEPQFLVEARLWIEGESRGEPRFVVEPNAEANIAVGAPEGVWQLTVKVEPVEDAFAPANTLWMHLGVDQRTAEGWEELTDSLLGVPEGEWATLSVVEGETESTPETASVYLEVRASRLDSPLGPITTK
jgi:hypothetical protein